MLISSIFSPAVPGAGSGPSEPEDPAEENNNTGGVETGGNATGGTATGGTAESGGASSQEATGAHEASGAGASLAHGASATDSRQNEVSRESTVRRAANDVAADIDLSRARAERTQKMLLQASLIDGMMQADDASMALFERGQSAAESTEQIAARYGEF